MRTCKKNGGSGIAAMALRGLRPSAIIGCVPGGGKSWGVSRRGLSAAEVDEL